MSTKEQARIIRWTKEGKYAPLEEWDQWLNAQIPEPQKPPGLKNVLGEDIGRRTIYKGNSAWNTKDITSTCATCPLYIPSDEAHKVSTHLKNQGESWMPKNQQGLCDYRDYRLKYLLPTPSPRACALGNKKREAGHKEQIRLFAVRKKIYAE
jgi:hypothetical protein